MCPCFQKRSRQDNEAIIPRQDSVKWSIRLGFNGEINPAFENKYLNVMEVRWRIKKEIAYAIIFSAIFISAYPFINLGDNYVNDAAKIMCVAFSAVSLFAVLAHLKIVIEWTRHDKKMEKEYRGKEVIDANST